MAIPRTLLLTWYAPDTPYKIIREIAARLDCDRLCWCSLGPSDTGKTYPYRHKSLTPRRLHWRLHTTTANHVYMNEVQARGIAAEICAWVADFRPEVIWAVSELAAVNVGYHLQRMLGVPLHATVQDAPETASFTLPALYYRIHMRSVAKYLRLATSVDAISDELLAHLVGQYANVAAAHNIAFPPSVPAALVLKPPDEPGFAADGNVRRIGFCGSMRVSEWQWRDFVGLLARLPFTFEIIAFAFKELFHDVPLPANVTVHPQPYADTEADIIRAFRERGVHACYLGLFREPEKELFARTSLSAKMTTYVAAGLPVIVDGPESSVAWRLARDYGAGVLYVGNDAAALKGLQRMFGEPDAWLAMASGAGRLCREELDLERNIRRFETCLSRSASGGEG